jgi:hypothetical protein
MSRSIELEILLYVIEARAFWQQYQTVGLKPSKSNLFFLSFLFSQVLIQPSLKLLIELMMSLHSVIWDLVPYRYMSSPDVSSNLGRIEVVLDNRAGSYMGLLWI